MNLRWPAAMGVLVSLALAHPKSHPPAEQSWNEQTTPLGDSLPHQATASKPKTAKIKARPGGLDPRPQHLTQPQEDLSFSEAGGDWRFYQSGWASWYGPRFHGRLTASGQRYNQYGISAAHLRLPMGTRVRVTNLRTGKSIVLRINDRGPYSRYVIDLSWGAKEAIGMVDIAPVRIEVIPQ